MNTRRMTLVIAIILAVGTGWLTLSYLSSLQSQNAASKQPRQVIVAATDIPARAPITAAMIERVVRPASSVPADVETDPKVVIGSLSLMTIPAGSAIAASQVGQPAAASLPVRLTPGMRAVSIQIDHVKGVSGLLQAGDRVDVISVPQKQGTQPPPAATILRGVRILAIGNTIEYSSATPSPQDDAATTTVTLEVTPTQADLLAMADVNTTLRLALRSPREAVNSLPPETLHFPAQSDPPQGGGSAPAAAAAPAAPARTAYRASNVVVIDQDHVGIGASQGATSGGDEP